MVSALKDVAGFEYLHTGFFEGAHRLFKRSYSKPTRRKATAAKKKIRRTEQLRLKNATVSNFIQALKLDKNRESSSCPGSKASEFARARKSTTMFMFARYLGFLVERVSADGFGLDTLETKTIDFSVLKEDEITSLCTLLNEHVA